MVAKCSPFHLSVHAHGISLIPVLSTNQSPCLGNSIVVKLLQTKPKKFNIDQQSQFTYIVQNSTRTQQLSLHQSLFQSHRCSDLKLALNVHEFILRYSILKFLSILLICFTGINSRHWHISLQQQMVD